MDTVRQNFSAYFRTTQIIFFALLAGQILASGVLLFVLSPGLINQTYRGEEGTGVSTGIVLYIPHTNKAFKDAYLNYLAPLAVIGLLGLSFYLYVIKVRAAKEHANLQEKLLAYRSAQILKWALIEAATLIGVVTFMISGNIQYLILTGASMVVFALQGPSKTKLINDLDLSVEEQSILDDPDAVVVT